VGFAIVEQGGSMPSSKKPLEEWTDEEFIARFSESAKKMPWPKFLGRLQRQGYSKPLAVYLIWCYRCRLSPNKGFTVMHSHGYERRLQCSYCKERYDHLLPERKIGDMFLNPHRHLRFTIFLFLCVTFLLQIVSHC